MAGVESEGLITMNTAIEIRDAQPSDAKTILHFINELAIYEKEPDAVKTNEQIGRASCRERC